MNSRRQFISLLGGAATAWPRTLLAEQSKMPVIGFLTIGSLETTAYLVTAFRKGLSEQGYAENRNVTIEMRFAANAHYDRLFELVSELVRHPVDLLIATGSADTARAAKAATTSIPIVFANGSDPVKVGLVASMNRPSGNATGVSFYTSALGPKRLELLRELVPQASTIAFLVNPTNPVTKGDIEDLESAARSVGQRILVVTASSEDEIDAALATVARERAGAILVNVDAFFTSRRHQLISLADRYRIPASYNNNQYTKAGGLMSYGDDRLDSYRQVGVYAGRILKGDKPADLPVMQPTKFEFAINLKTAKVLGLTVPPMLVARADEVIE